MGTGSSKVQSDNDPFYECIYRLSHDNCVELLGQKPDNEFETYHQLCSHICRTYSEIEPLLDTLMMSKHPDSLFFMCEMLTHHNIVYNSGLCNRIISHILYETAKVMNITKDYPVYEEIKDKALNAMMQIAPCSSR